MIPRLIGIASPAARCGKSTISCLLQEEYSFVQEKFAGPLKVMWAALCMAQGVSKEKIAESLEGVLKEVEIPEIGFSFRTFAEKVGTPCVRRMIRDDAWVNMAKARFEQKLAAGLRLVVDDVRFPNEADLIRELGGKVIYITRPGYTPSRDSEGHLTKYHFDARFPNDRTQGDLMNDVRAWIASAFLQVS